MISEVKWCFFYSYFVIYIFYLEGNNIEEWEAKDIGICAQKKLYKVRKPKSVFVEVSFPKFSSHQRQINWVAYTTIVISNRIQYTPENIHQKIYTRKSNFY